MLIKQYDNPEPKFAQNVQDAWKKAQKAMFTIVLMHIV